MLSSDPARGVRLVDVKAGLAEPSALPKSVTDNTTLVKEPEIKAALKSVDAPSANYVEAEGKVIDPAGRYPAPLPMMKTVGHGCA